MKKIAAALAACALMALAGCDNGSSQKGSLGMPGGPPPTSDAATLVVMAGSELKDMEALLPDLERATGVKVQLAYSGTLEAVERLQGSEPFDAAWLASNRYAMLIPEVKAKVAATERTMMTPVVLGLRESKARELGWTNRGDVTWKDIAKAAGQGKFTFAMTSPTSSNSGFAGLLGLAAALSEKGDALEAKDVDAKSLARFFKAQRLTAGSSGWLAEAFVKEQDKVDGMVNYASTLASLNKGPALREKLFLVYPKDGIMTADYPFMLVNSAKRAAYEKVVAHLRSPEFQSAMSKATLRRPVNPDAISSDEGPANLVELSFPAKLDVVDAVLASFDNVLRLPADSTFVLDRSGSMAGARMNDLKAAMLGLAGGDPTLSGRFAKFRERETIRVVTFSDVVDLPDVYQMTSEGQANAKTLAAISERVNRIDPNGGTALFEAARQAYLESASRRRADPERYYSIVVMTDGESNQGISAREFEAWYNGLPDADKGVKVFAVVFGEGNPAQLKTIAELTGGRVFDGRKAKLAGVFKEIRGYQ